MKNKICLFLLTLLIIFASTSCLALTSTDVENALLASSLVDKYPDDYETNISNITTQIMNYVSTNNYTDEFESYTNIIIGWWSWRTENYYMIGCFGDCDKVYSFYSSVASYSPYPFYWNSDKTTKNSGPFMSFETNATASSISSSNRYLSNTNLYVWSNFCSSYTDIVSTVPWSYNGTDYTSNFQFPEPEEEGLAPVVTPEIMEEVPAGMNQVATQVIPVAIILLSLLMIVGLILLLVRSWGV